jgi:hypothetical protein
MVDEIVQRISEKGLEPSGFLDIAFERRAPDQDAIRMFRKLVSEDSSLLVRTIVGMNYRDATIEFGLPTKKKMLSKAAEKDVAEWHWALEDDERVFKMHFRGGFAIWAGFGPSE